jgi:RimJ/RimL family protein N-acetyltransferase
VESRLGVLDHWYREHSIASDTVALRPLQASDRRALHRTIDDEVLHWQGWRSAESNGFSRRQANSMRWLERRLQRQGRMPSICASNLVVTEPDGTVIGSFRITVGEPPELGWWLGPSGRGRGLGVEMLRLGLEYAHGHVDIPTLAMATAADNIRVRAQIEQCGGTLVDQFPRTLPNDATVLSVVYHHTDFHRAT